MPLSTVSLAIGIDIGAKALHVATTPDRATPVQVIDLREPGWDEQLAALIPYQATVAFEPTGMHYSAAVVSVLKHLDAKLIQVEHRVTGLIRDTHIAASKRDYTDARALAYIAATYHLEALLGVKRIHASNADQMIALRILVWSYTAATRQSVRAQNRLRQMAHAIWPALGIQFDTYRRAIDAGYVTPAELRKLAQRLETGKPYPDGYQHYNARSHFVKLVNSLPDWLNHEALRPAIISEAATLIHQEQRKAALYEQITALTDQEPLSRVSALWSTIPYSSAAAIAALHVATNGRAEDLTRDQFRAALGFHPTVKQSGDSLKSEAAKGGFRPAKALLHMWMQSLIKNGDNPIAASFQRRKASGQGHTLADTRQRLADLLSAIARSGKPYDAARSEVQR